MGRQPQCRQEAALGMMVRGAQQAPLSSLQTSPLSPLHLSQVWGVHQPQRQDGALLAVLPLSIQPPTDPAPPPPLHPPSLRSRGVANRDVKMENCLLDPVTASRPLLKICDFSYSKVSGCWLPF